MTAADASDTEPATAQGPVRLQGAKGVLGTGWAETTGGGPASPQRLVQAHDAGQEARRNAHLAFPLRWARSALFSSAAASESRSCVNDSPTAAGLGVITYNPP